MNILIDRVSKSYGKLQVLNEVSLDIEENAIYCLIGRNGAGKSTLLNIITNLIKLDRGAVAYNNMAYLDWPVNIKKSIGILSDKASLLDELTLEQHLNLIGLFYNIDKETRANRIEKFIDYFFSDNKTTIARKKISSFSTGMKKKLEIITASFHYPEFLVLDEPFSGLDPTAGEDVIEFLKDYQESAQRTILFSSHDLDYVEKINSIIILLDEGAIKFKGTVQEFINAAGTKFHESILNALNYQKTNSKVKWQ